MSISKKLIVHGRVQGVCYRAYIKDYANKLNIEGYVKNLTDGTVEIVAICDYKSNFEEFLKYVKKGSPWSRVENIEINDYNNDDVFKGFIIRY